MEEKQIKEKRKKLFKIGQIAKLFDLTIQTLHYYERVGILKPEYIDPINNYRYYSINQFERLNTIKYLRNSGVSIENITTFFAENDLNELVDLLKEQQAVISKKIEELKKSESNLNSRISEIQSALREELGEISVQTITQRKIIKVEKHFSSKEEIEYLLRELSEKYAVGNAIFLGKIGISIEKEKIMNGHFTNYSSLFMILEEADAYDYSEVIEAEGTYVTIRFNGNHAAAGAFYEKCLQFIEENGYELSGDALEIALIDEGITDDLSQFVTEIQLPVILNNEKNKKSKV